MAVVLTRSEIACKLVVEQLYTDVQLLNIATDGGDTNQRFLSITVAFVRYKYYT